MKKFLAIVLVVSTLVFTTPVETAHAAGPTDYISCWDLDETSGTRFDANTTNSNDLTDTNTVLYAAGKQGNAADFESTNSEYLTITDANQVGLDVTTAATWSYWVNFESDTDAVVIDKTRTGTAPTNSYWILHQGGTGNYNGLSNSAETYLAVLHTLNNATWYHVVWTYNAGTAELFVDGVSKGTASNGTALTNTTAPFTLGRVNKYTGNYMDGLMDIVEVYNRVLTGAEITALYNSGNGTACTGRDAAPATSPAITSDFFIFDE